MAGREIVGFRAAAEHLGIKASTLRGYRSRGTGPVPVGVEIVRGSAQPVFTVAELDRWKAARHPGRRTDKLR